MGVAFSVDNGSDRCDPPHGIMDECSDDEMKAYWLKKYGSRENMPEWQRELYDHPGGLPRIPIPQDLPADYLYYLNSMNGYIPIHSVRSWLTYFTLKSSGAFEDHKHEFVLIVGDNPPIYFESKEAAKTYAHEKFLQNKKKYIIQATTPEIIGHIMGLSGSVRGPREPGFYVGI